MDKTSIKTFILATFSLLSTHISTIAQNKFTFGASIPNYYGTGRFGSYLDLKNDLQGHSGSDALQFKALNLGIGLFGELQFNDEWSFDIYWQKYTHTTNFGKNNIDAFTHSANGSATSQYKMSHGIMGVGVSRKTFDFKGYQVWIFSAMSAGTRKFAWRPEGGSFSKERTTTNRLFISHEEKPIYFNIGLSPRIPFAKKFVFTPKVGYEMELMKGDGDAFGDGLPNIVQASYSTGLSQSDSQAIWSEYTDKLDKSLNRFFIEFRVGMKLGN